MAAEAGVRKIPLRRMIGEPPRAILVKYRDGLKGTVLHVGYGAVRWNVACRLKNEDAPRATYFYGGPWNNRGLFRALSHAIQQHFVNRRSPYPVERTLLTTRSASVSVGPSVESGARFSNSASKIGCRSLISPFACSVPMEPIPNARITVYAITIATSAPNASPPPKIALRHVRCFAIPASGTRYVPVAAASTRSRSLRPVTSMIGIPITSSTAAPGNTQSGRPSRWRSTNTTASTSDRREREQHRHAHRLRAPERRLGATRECPRRPRRPGGRHPATRRRHRL